VLTVTEISGVGGRGRPYLMQFYHHWNECALRAAVACITFVFFKVTTVEVGKNWCLWLPGKWCVSGSTKGS